MEDDPPDSNEGGGDMIYDYKTPPPWYFSMVLGFQHFLSMCTPNAISTLIIADYLCLQNDSTIKSELISTSFFVMGISSFLQTVCGCRLPIIQGATFILLLPAISMMNIEQLKQCNITENIYIRENFNNSTIPESVFHLKIRLISGALMISSVVEIIIPISGLLGIFTRLISPLSLSAIYMVLALGISETLIPMMAQQWGIAFVGIAVTIVFTAILAPKPIPIPRWTKNSGWIFERVKIFQISPIIMSLSSGWIICGILTVTGVFSTVPGGWGYAARTDIKMKAIYDSPIIKIPYPFQWGSPLMIPSAVIGVSAGIVFSVIESVSDYILTADVCKAPKVPSFAINRGILVEGIGVFLSGMLGSAVAPTSYSGNIGVLKMTKAGNILIGQVASVIMIACGIFPIIGAIFVSIPHPVMSGVIFVVSLMVMACAISNFQYFDIFSTRNIIVFGFSVAFGLYFPPWCVKNKSILQTGNTAVDDVLQLVLSINLFITAVSSIFLDNILPKGDAKEIEISDSNDMNSKTKCKYTELERCIAFDSILLKWLAERYICLQYLPVFPAYKKLKEKKNLQR